MNLSHSLGRRGLGRVAAGVVPVTLAGVLFAQPAFAHIVQGPIGGFGSGFEHPLTGPDHFIAMMAVGLWGAQMGGRSVWTLPVTFPLVMVIGGIVGILGFSVPFIEIGIALSIVVLGSAIAARWHAPEAVALLLISFFALCHGYAHGVELPNAADPADYAIGFVLATGLIHLVGIGIGLGLKGVREGGLIRIIGFLIVASGIYYLVT